MFSGLLGKKLSLTWEYTVQGVLWRLFPSAHGILIGEDRDLEKKTVSFFCLDDRSGAVRWKDVTFAEAWWISMESLHDGTLLLHEYAAPDMPDHKKIYAVDAATGRTLWSNDDVKFLCAHGDHLYAAKETFEDRLYSEFSIADGRFVRAVDAEEMRAIQRSLGAGVAEIVEFPSVARPGEQADPDLAPALASVRLSSALEVQAEYISGPNRLVVAACVPADPAADERKFRQRIIVYDRAKRRAVFDDRMNEKLLMPVPDMFFCRGGVLYYIKEKQTLCAVNLGGNEAL